MLSSPPPYAFFPNESLVSVPVLYPYYDQVDLCERSIFHSLRLNRQLNCLANFVRDAATNLNVTVSNVTADKFFFFFSAFLFVFMLGLSVGFVTSRDDKSISSRRFNTK